MPARPALSLEARALQLLAQREHSALEMRRKLVDHALKLAADAWATAPSRRVRAPGADVQAEIDALLARLQEDGRLSDARFAESRLRVRASRWGNLRLRDELARHGLSPSAEESEALAASELERARAVWARKFDALPADAAQRARQARFLAGRGFSSEAIRRVLRDAAD